MRFKVRNARGETPRSIRVATYLDKAVPLLIALEYITASDVFVLSRNGVTVSTTPRGGRNNEDFAEVAATAFRDALVVAETLRVADTDVHLLERRFEGNMAAAQNNIKNLFKSLEKKR